MRLGEYFGQKPVVLAFVYYDCPMLCTQVLSSMTSTLGVLSLDAGKDFELVVVSFDPRENAGAGRRGRKPNTSQRYDRPAAADGWHFLTGDAAVDRAPDQRGGLPLRLGRGDAAVRASRRASSC